MSGSTELPPTDGDATAALDEPGWTEAETTKEVPTGSHLGRYVVLGSIGRGGMGRVLRAYDPKLQREVALKLVLTDPTDAEARDRTLREARAMAKLSHANVVAVYDAEETEAGVVLVMEYVPGRTLRRWCEETDRGWRAVVDAFVEAGRGLAAAHEVGMLHRDFKPANVLVAESGAVKVTDFGLAKLASATGSEYSEGRGSVRPGDSLDGVLTQADVVVGTPRYMPPEQLAAAPLGPAADQYAFCVALWEALCDEPPFRGPNVRKAKAKGPPSWPKPEIPGAIAAAIRRGLAPEPDDRWPTMNALLAALAYEPARRRLRWLLGGGAFAVAAVSGLVAQQWFQRKAERCSGAERRLAGVWDDEARARVEAAIEGIEASYADAVWTRTRGKLDAYAQRWAEMYTEACAATTIRGEQSAAAMDLQIGCLHRAQTELEAVVGVLAEADDEVVAKAHDVVAALPDLDRCADVEALREDVPPPPPEEAKEVDAVRRLVALAHAQRQAGHFDAALERIEDAEGRLERLQYEPIQTEVLLERSFVLERLGKYADADASLRRTIELASANEQWELLREAAIHSLMVVGYQEQRADEGLRYREFALGLAKGDPLYEAQANNNIAAVLSLQGRYAEAEVEHRKALAQRIAVLGEDNPAVASSHNNLGIALAEQWKQAEAEAEYRRAIAAWTAALGPDHPTISTSKHNLAKALGAQGKYEQAEAEARRTLAIRLDALGPEHPYTAATRDLLATILGAQGKYEEAEREHRAALAVFEKVLGLDHPETVQVHNNLATVLLGEQRFDEAEAELRRAAEGFERALGPEHPNVATAHGNLGVVLAMLGKYDEAEPEHRRALALRKKIHGDDHPDVAQSRSNLAAVLSRQGRDDEALPLAERAWDRRARDDVPAAERAETAFVLAEVLWKTREDPESRERARHLAQRAHEDFTAAGAAAVDQLHDVADWLRAHR